jgi:hypothetical protein
MPARTVSHPGPKSFRSACGAGVAAHHLRGNGILFMDLRVCAMVREQCSNNNCKSTKGWTRNDESAFCATLLIRNFPLEFTEDTCLSCHCSTESTTETSKADLAISVTPMSTHTHTHEGQLYRSSSKICQRPTCIGSQAQDSRPLSLRRCLLQKRLVDMHNTTTNANTSSFDCLQRRRVTLPRLRVTSRWLPLYVMAMGMGGEDVQCLDFFLDAIFRELAIVSFALELD